MGLHLGIDFGTSTNYITRWNEDKKTVEPVLLGGYGKGPVFPNVIYYESKDNVLVGDEAVRKGKLDIFNRVEAVKRHIEERGYWRYIPNLGMKLTSTEIARDIFRWIKKNIEEKYGGEPIDDVVISVPFAYQNSERLKIKNAAANAGLNVRGLIEEPVAAALSFGLLDSTTKGNKEKILVFDLGGGTFDVTIFEFQKKSELNFQIRVLTTGGAKEMGGIDIDNLMVDRIREMMESEYPEYNLSDISQDMLDKESAKMRNIAIELKENLSYSDEEDVYFDSNIIDAALDETVEVDDFNQWLKEFVAQIEDVVESTLNDADLEAKDIDRIILVGGTSNIPRIAEALEEIFHKAPEKIKEPNMLVGEGAGIYCGLRYVEKTLDCDIVIGVSHAIGIKPNGRFKVMIPRNTPYNKPSDFEILKVRKQDRELELNVYQGTSVNNQKIGKVVITKSIQNKLADNRLAIRLNTDASDGTVIYELYDVKNDMPDTLLTKEALKGE